MQNTRARFGISLNAHAADAKWYDAVEIAKQFLREVREDDGVRVGPKHNEFY